MCRILILDDNEEAANQVKDTILMHQYDTVNICYRFEDAFSLVQNAVRRGKPYEIFLIDLILGPGKDGIDAMKELRRISPDSDAIIFTGYGDLDSGLKAYRAGAFRYLPKPFENPELLFLLETLKEWRKAQQEHGWQKVFSRMMESALKQVTFNAVVDVVLTHSLELGFERAYLFWVPTRDDRGKGLLLWKKTTSQLPPQSCNSQLFSDWFGIFKIHQPYSPIFLSNQEIKIPKAELRMADYSLALRETTILPLGSGKKLLGALVLDHGHVEKNLSQNERQILNLFMRQVSTIMEHAIAYGHEQRALEESDSIRMIAREVTKSAINGDLPALLEEVRQQLEKMIGEVSNFAVAMWEKETDELVFPLHYEDGIRYVGELRQPASSGLEGLLLSSQQEILLQDKAAVKKTLQQNDIRLNGKLPASWMGTLLFVGGEPVGCIAIKRLENQKPLTEHDLRLFVDITNQVTSAIHACQSAYEEREEKERIQTLQRASFEMMQIAQRDQDLFWLTVLTLATADFGLGFNRALLFLADENRALLRGKSGIGTDKKQDAIRDWKHDKQRSYGFDDFLTQLETGQISNTPFGKIIGKVIIKLDILDDAIRTVMNHGRRVVLAERELPKRLPHELTKRIALSSCALLPLRAGSTILGLVIVDNKHNQKSIEEKTLNRLQTLLDNAGLVWETQRQNQKSEVLLDANYQIMSDAEHQTLAHTLDNICKTARKISEADWAIIYPIRPGKTTHYKFDTENIGHDGQIKSLMQDIRQTKPRLGGVSAHVLEKGMLKISDIDGNDPLIEKLQLIQHRFIETEGVKALLGVHILDPHTQEPLGILYLDYRHSRDFSAQEVHHAKSFASLAAVAISNARRPEEQRQRQRLKVALDTAETISKELEMGDILAKVFKKLSNIFKETSICVLEYDADENALKFAPATLQFYRIINPEYKNTKSFSLAKSEKGSIACQVARKALKTRKTEHINEADVSKNRYYMSLTPKTKAELCVSLMSSDGSLLGVLALERSLSAFDEDDFALVETVARQLALAMERAQKGEKLNFLSTVSAMTAWASDIAHDIKSEIGNIKSFAYLIKENSPENPKIQDYAGKIDESARVLSDVGYWNTQAKTKILMDGALERCIEPFARQRGIQTAYDFQATNISILANRMELKRIFRHLVRNADREMAQEAVKLIKISTRRAADDKVEILFRDSGPGVQDETVRSAIFRRRIDKKDSGGFGLLFVRQVIEGMEGTIRLLPPAPNERGAVFSIKLPIVDNSKIVE